MAKPEKVAIIECDDALLIEIATHLQHSLTGKPIFYSDTLIDLVRRHCPDIYDIASDAGYTFIPSDNKDELTRKPPDLWFDIIRKSDPNELKN